MLKNYGYAGTYHDGNISVSVLLENPLDYGFEASTLVFSVILKVKNVNAIKAALGDFNFYFMDETNRLYNAQSIPYSKPDADITSEDDEPVRQPDGLIHIDFKHEFLFQDMRIAFYYRPYMRINIIKLEH